MSEANLVDELRKKAKPIVSLVAMDNTTIVGHILFTSVALTGYTEINLMGLAPMAVSPEYQRKGIGSELVRTGLERCKDLGIGAVGVLGHPEFYPHFGFKPSTNFGITCEYDVPEDAFMLLELSPDYLKGKSGMIKYHDAFKKL